MIIELYFYMEKVLLLMGVVLGVGFLKEWLREGMRGLLMGVEWNRFGVG